MNKEKLVLLVDRNEAAILADAIRSVFLAAGTSGLGSRYAMFKKLWLMIQLQRKKWQIQDNRFQLNTQIQTKHAERIKKFLSAKDAGLPPKKKLRKGKVHSSQDR